MERWEPSVADAEEEELGPPAELACNDVGRSSLHDNPAGHRARNAAAKAKAPFVSSVEKPHPSIPVRENGTADRKPASVGRWGAFRLQRRTKESACTFTFFRLC